MSSVCIAKSKKQLAIFYKLMLKTNISALYRIKKVNDVALVLGTYSPIARHRLCGRDTSGERYTCIAHAGLFASTRRH